MATTKGIRRTDRGWEVSITRNGIRKTALCKTKAEAAKRRSELEKLVLLKAEQSPVLIANKITLGEAARNSELDRWAHIKSGDAVRSNLKQVVEFLGKDTLLSSIDRMDLVAMQKHWLATGNRPATVNKKLALLRSIYTDATKDKLVSEIPNFPKKLAVQSIKDRVFSREEEAGFIAAFKSHPDRSEGADIFAFLLDSCARWSEIEKLKVGDVNFDRECVTFEGRKANNTGSVPLTRRALQIARKYSTGSQNSPLFSVKYDCMKSWFNFAKASLGITDPRLTLHSTRHTCATRLSEANCSLSLIMRYGGWTSYKSVIRYQHVQTDALLQCVDVLQRDQE